MRRYITKKRSDVRFLSILVVGVLLGIGLVSFFLLRGSKAAAWYSDNWKYRKSVQITSTHGSSQSNVYVTISSYDTSDTTKYQADCGDIRFTKANGQELAYYVVSGCGTASTTIHIQFDSLPNGTSYMYLYYGNPNVANGTTSSDFTTAASNYSIGTIGSEEVGEGPNAYWRFDEGYGTSVNDSTGNGNTGTLGTGTTAPSWQSEEQCINGKCLLFDGDNDTVSVTDSNDLDIKDTASIQAWIKTPVESTPLSTFSSWTNLTAPDGGAILQAGDIDAIIVGTKIYYAAFLHVSSTENFSTANSNLDGSGFSGWTVQTAPNGVGNNEATSIAIGSDGTKLYYIAFANSATAETIHYANSNLDGSGLTTWTSFTAPDGGDSYDMGTIDMVIVGNTQYLAAYLHNDATDEFSTASIDLDGSNFSGWTVQAAPGGTNAYDVASVALESDGSQLYYAALSSDDLIESFKTATSDLDGTNFSGWTSRAAPDGVNHQNYSGIDVVLAAGKLYYGAYLHNNTVETYYTASMMPDGSGFTGWTSRAAPDGSATGGLTMTAIATNGTGLYYVSLATTSGTEYFYVAADTGLRYSPILSKEDAYTVSITGSQFSLEWAGTTLNFGTISANKWYHVAITHDGSTVHGYIDGKLEGSLSSTTDFSTNGNNLMIGGDGAAFFKGVIDEVKIYPYARTADEIKQDYLFASTKGSSVVLGASDRSFLSQGLVGYWNMNGIGSTGNGVSISERSGNDNDGTTSDTNSSGMSCATVGKYGASCDFDGTDDYIGVNDSSTLDITGTMTITAWVKMGTVKEQSILSKWNLSSQSNASYAFATHWTNTDEFYLALDENGAQGSSYFTISTNADLTSGEWYHLAAVWDGSVVSLYKNGNKLTTSTLNSPPTSIYSGAANLNIGAQGDGASVPFDGNIDEVRLYNRSLSSSEIKSLYEWAPGPVAYWDFDEGTGTSLNDKSGNGNNSTAWTGNTHWVPGKYGSATSHDGSGDRITIPSSSTLDYQPTYTWSLWLNPTGGSYEIIDKSADTNNGWKIGSNGNKYALTIFYTGTDLTCIIPAVNMSVGEWQHIAWTWDGSNTCTGVKFYKNGVIIAYESTTTPTGTREIDTGKNILIGGNGYTDYPGMIDDFKIYNYARTQSQILEDMNAGHPTVGTPIGSTVLHLSMDEGYGTTVHDKSPQENNGTLGTGSSAPSWTNDGKFAKALNFDGTNDYVSMSDISFSATDSWTASLWLREDDAESGWSFFLGRIGTTGESILYSNSSNQLQFRTDDTSYIGGPAITRNQWNHAVVTYDNGTIYIYVNGNQYGPYTKSTTMIFNGIGAAYTDNHYFKGKIDEVKIYPVALTSDQVLQEYQGGKAIVFGAQNTGVGGSSPSNAASREQCVPGDATTCNSPVLELNFEESTGQTAYDTSTNGNNGTLGSSGSVDSADPTWGLGPGHMAGSALKFDGIDDYVTTSDIDLTTKTITAWVKLDVGSNTFHKIVSKRVGYTDNPGSFEVDTTAGDFRLVYGWNQAAHYTAVSSISEGVWQFIAVTHNPGVSAPIFYINGKQVSSSSWFGGTPGNVSNNAAWYIGSAPEQDTFTKGIIDQVKIYDYVRTPAQIAWDYSKGAPIAHYRLDECQGATANNSAFTPSGTAGNNGTINPGSSGNTSVGTCTSGSGTEMWANGASGQWEASLDFDEADDRVVIPDMDIGQESTISFWFNSADNTGTGYQYMYSHGTIQTANSINIYFNEDSNGVNTPGAILVSVMDSNDGVPLLAQDVQTQIGLSDSTWHHLVVTITSSGTKAYIDGVQQVSYTNGNDGVNPSGSIYIGARNDLDSQRYYDGKLDDVRIYNYALTTTQIKELYKGGAVTFK